MQLVDSHCHINFEPLAGDMAGLLARAAENGVGHMLCVCVNLEDLHQVLGLARENTHIFASVGVHPCTTEGEDPEVDRLVALADDDRVVAIGETGLDYFYDNAPRDAQRRSFARHVELAAELALPVVVHSREAVADTAAVIREGAGRVTGVLHCFTGPADLLELAMDAGWYVSFTGIATFRSFDDALARDVPRDRYMIETDAPYLAPVPKRGRRNEPAFVPHVAAALARIRGEALEQVAADSWASTARFYGLNERGRAAGVSPREDLQERGPRP